MPGAPIWNPDLQQYKQQQGDYNFNDPNQFIQDPWRNESGGGSEPISGLPPSPTPAPTSAPAPSPAPAPSDGYNLEAFRKSWMSGGDIYNPQAWLDANRNITQGVTLQGDKAYDPSGKFIADLIGNYSGAPQSEWSRIFLDGIGSNGQPRTASTSSGTSLAAPSGTMAPLPAGAPTGGLQSTLTQSLLSQFGGAATNDQNNQMDEMVRQAILQLLGQGMESGLPDTGKSPQAQQFRLSSQREAERARADAMEARAQQGLLHSGPAEGDIEGIDQARAESQARFEVGLTQMLLTERQQKLALALQTGAGMLNAEQERALRAELAAVDAALAQNRLQLDWQSLANQNQQFYDDLGFRIGDREAYWNSQTAGAMM